VSYILGNDPNAPAAATLPECIDQIVEEFPTNPPILAIPAGVDTYSIRFEADLEFSGARSVTMQAVSDDGIAVRVNGAVVLEEWNVHASHTYTLPSVAVQNGTNRVVVDYYNMSNTFGEVRLGFWTPPTAGNPSFVPWGTKNIAKVTNLPNADIIALAHRPGYGTYYINDRTNTVAISGAGVNATGFGKPTALAYYESATEKILYIAATNDPDNGTGTIWKADVGGPFGIPTVTKLSTGFNKPAGLAVSTTGTIYVADAGNGKVYTVNPTTGIAASIVSGQVGVAPSISLQGYDLSAPKSLAISGDRLYIGDVGSGRIIEADMARNEVREVVNSSQSYSFSPGSNEVVPQLNSTQVETGFGEAFSVGKPDHLAALPNGDILFVDSDDGASKAVIYRFVAATHQIETIAGTNLVGITVGATTADPISPPTALTVSGNTVYFANDDIWSF
jgi:hypothetical protein